MDADIMARSFIFSQNDLITIESEGHHQKLKPFVNRGMT